MGNGCRISSSGATHASDFEAFQKYSHLCARNVTPRLHANFSEVVDANNEENVQSKCNEPINSACLHTEGEGTNISGAGHANIVENAQTVCNEPINSTLTMSVLQFRPGVKKRVKTLRQDD
ncbi:hypothetical protein Tco_1432976 [Tanacetum coccineum]